MIQFLDLKEQYNALRPEIMEAIETVFSRAQFVLGPAVEAFERKFAEYCGAEHAVGTNSGTTALHLALLGHGVGPGDEVITIPHTFVATVAAIEYAGARPVFVDIDPVGYTMDPKGLAAALTPRTKAIMPVHLYGLPADMGPILEFAGAHGLPVIEDAAQAHGAEYQGKRCGSMGASAAFSFYPGKNLGAYGEGGAIVTSDGELAKRLRVLRDWGQDGKYNHVVKGFNARLEGVQGAVLGVKMGHIEAWTEARRERAARYDELLKDCRRVIPPRPFPDRRHVYHIYAVRVEDRPGFMAFLKDRGVPTSIHYPTPVHLLPAYADLGYSRGAFPISETVAASVVSLPMYPEMPLDDVDKVAEVVREWDSR